MNLLATGQVMMLMKLNKGFTLIEVLVAMVILAVAFLAVMKASTQSIVSIRHVENRQIAYWVGLQAMNAILAGTMNIQNSEKSQQNITSMLGRDWAWQAKLSNTDNPLETRVDVNVVENVLTQQKIALVGFMTKPLVEFKDAR